MSKSRLFFESVEFSPGRNGRRVINLDMITLAIEMPGKDGPQAVVELASGQQINLGTQAWTAVLDYFKDDTEPEVDLSGWDKFWKRDKDSLTNETD